jgi:hypothetical protein
MKKVVTQVILLVAIGAGLIMGPSLASGPAQAAKRRNPVRTYICVVDGDDVSIFINNLTSETASVAMTFRDSNGTATDGGAVSIQPRGQAPASNAPPGTTTAEFRSRARLLVAGHSLDDRGTVALEDDVAWQIRCT